MTALVANTLITNTFDYWRNRTNEVASAMSTLAVTVNSNTAVGNAAITGAFNYNTAQIYSSNTMTAGATLQVIDSYLITNYRTADYIISVKDNTANNYYASRFMVTHDSGTVYTTEYAVLITNTAIGVFGATINGTAVSLNFTPVSTNTTVNFTRTLVTV